MTGGKPAHPYGTLIRLLTLLVGVLLLADSVTQLIQAAGDLEVGSRNWRLVNLRLLFTQVTPLTPAPPRPAITCFATYKYL